MLWAFASATATGIVFGLFLRWPTVLAASVMIAACCVALMPIAHWSLLPATSVVDGPIGFVLSRDE
jgi:hypothetical protein